MIQMEKGNTSELWKVSYPMMITFFSMMFMIFADRLFLSWYSTTALNAAVKAGTLAWGVILGWITMAAMSEVLVAQYNGAKKYENIGIPVWQMIWLSIGSFLFYIPVGVLIAPMIYDPYLYYDEFVFFQILMFFGPVFSLVPAVSGFYIGRGQTQIIQWMAIVGNLVNIVLDPIFIFGIEGYFPSLGIAGAAIATGIGTFVQFIVLLLVFLKKKYRDSYGTDKIAFDYPIFSKTIKVGLPPSIFLGLELLGWAFFFHFMATISEVHIFVVSVCQSIIMLFLFFGMGIEKGSIALAGNFIGAKKKNNVKNVFRSGLILNGFFMIIAALFMIIYPNPLIDWFFQNPDVVEKFADLDIVNVEEVKFLVRIGLLFSYFYISFENIRWVLNGMLTAAGDTLYLLISGTICVWGVLIIPTYFLVVLPKSNLIFAFVIWVLYALTAVIINYYRFASGRWKKNILIEEPAHVREEIS